MDVELFLPLYSFINYWIIIACCL